ncbi:MAG: hypothetical protein AAF555_02955 [Verrucomicrobiota bacterium]
MRFFGLVWLALLTGGGLARAQPEVVRALPPEVRALPPQNGSYRYVTRHFQHHSPEALPIRHLEHLAVLADSIPLLLQAHPLPLYQPSPQQPGHIQLYANEDDFVEAGGFKNLAGIYLSLKQRTLLRADLLFPAHRMPASARLPERHDNLVLHELIHHSMHGFSGRVPHWFYEGLAEYLVAHHDGGGSFSFGRTEQRLREHLELYYSTRQPIFSVVPLADLIRWTDQEWNDLLAELEPEDRYQPYASALLLVHYHLSGPSRLAALDSWLKQLLQPNQNLAPFPMTAAELNVAQERLQDFWRRRGVTLHFSLPTPPDPRFYRAGE